MPHGYSGKILRVDLTEEKIEVEEPGELFFRKYMGGATLGAYYLLKELDPGIDPLGPKNKIIFAASVVTGAPVSGFCRYAIVSKSPLTGGIADTQAGGWWAPQLKFAGYEAIIVEGQAEKPVYLWIDDGEVKIKDAKKIWGKDTGETQKIIREELGDEKIRIASTGQAGENLVRYACVLNELKHANGRLGMGAVMGSKNLKAIAVRGSGDINMADEKTVGERAKWFAQNFKDNVSNDRVSEYGTAELVNALNEGGMLPTENFKTGYFENAENLSGERMTEEILVKGEGCYACPVKCKRVVKTEEPYEVNPKYGGPEYETIGALGSFCCVDDLVAVSKGNELCNKYGLDTISTGNSIAFAMECFENGVIDEKDTGGIELEFGNADAMVKLVDKIAKREGIGDLLAEGVMRAAEKLGEEAEKYAMHSKGEEIAMHDGRAKGMVGFGYMVGPLGGDHVVVEHDTDFDESALDTWVEQAKPLALIERIEAAGMDYQKIRQFMYLQNHFSMMDSLALCVFSFAPVRTLTMEHLVELVNAITGWESSLWELMKQGEKRVTMFRAFNVREGFTPEDDSLPDRLYEPIKSGPLKGLANDREEYEEAKRLYYEMMGWDKETGAPKKSKLIEMDLEWLIDELKI